MGYLHDYPSAGLAMDAIMCSVKTGVGGLSTNMVRIYNIEQNTDIHDLVVRWCYYYCRCERYLYILIYHYCALHRSQT